MIKATLLLAGILALSLAATLDTNEKEGCKYADQLWGSPDGLSFFFCLPGTNISIEQACPPNTFFVKNSTVSGCVPLTMVNPSCVYVTSAEPGPCQGNNLKQPQPSINPTDFWVCTEEGAAPLKLSCRNGTAFVKQEGWMGCFPWDDWRKIRNCPENEQF